MAIKVRLLRRGKNCVIGGAEAIDVIGANIGVMEIADVHVNERVVFANAIEDIAGRTGLGAGSPGDFEGGWAGWRKRVEVAGLLRFEMTIDFERIMIASV